MPVPYKFLLPVKPTLTKEGWKNVMSRVLSKENLARLQKGELPKDLSEEVLKYEAPGVEKVGRLAKVGPEGTPYPVTLPIEEARQKFLESMGNLQAGRPAEYQGFVRGRMAPVYDLRVGRPESPFNVLGEEAPVGLEYRRLESEPILRPSQEQSVQAVKKEMTGPERPKTFMDTEVAGQSVSLGLLVDQIWKDIGDLRTVSGKEWRRLWQTDRVAHNYKSAKEYFARNFFRWHQNPEAYEKKEPYRGRLIRSIWETFQKETPE